MRRLWEFPGGLHLDDHKAESTRRPVERLPLPATLTVPLQQHIGEAAEILVAVGDRVLGGQTLARATGYVSAAVHAGTSGTVTAVEERPVPHPSGLTAMCVVIDTDGRDQWVAPLPPLDWQASSPMELRQRVRECGLVGLGGAAFPSSVKLNPTGER
ncbi:MAG TPA: electron transport complex subunit RsxC, partial [Gammaproteobacteria bacterium]|nr:electron transport complex subunit RsxC [Gammaproteobacteria bacterium]